VERIVAEGRIAKITDFWPEPTELPASRAHLVERYEAFQLPPAG
jgi:hypothetical protein